MKICPHCGEKKEASEFYAITLRSGNLGLASWCKKCSVNASSERNKKERKDNPERVRAKDKKRWAKRRLRELPVKRQRNEDKKDMCVQYLGGKCQLCGYNKCIAALDFHHINPDRKEFSITARMAPQKTWDEIKKELAKCILLCSNCHKELHYNNRR